MQQLKLKHTIYFLISDSTESWQEVIYLFWKIACSPSTRDKHKSFFFFFIVNSHITYMYTVLLSTVSTQQYTILNRVPHYEYNNIVCMEYSINNNTDKSFFALNSHWLCYLTVFFSHIFYTYMLHIPSLTQSKVLCSSNKKKTSDNKSCVNIIFPIFSPFTF